MEPSPTIQHIAASLASRLEATAEGLGPVFEIATLVASADGVIDAAETDALFDTLAALFGRALGRDVTRHLIADGAAAIRRDGAASRARALAATLAACGAVDDGLRLAVAVALSSQGLSPEERGVIEALASAAGVDAARLDALIADVRAATGAA